MTEKRDRDSVPERAELPAQSAPQARLRVIREQEASEEELTEEEQRDLLREIMDLDARIKQTEEELDLAEDALAAYEEDERQEQSRGWFVRMKARFRSTRREDEKQKTKQQRASIQELRDELSHTFNALCQAREERERFLPALERERREQERAKTAQTKKEVEEEKGEGRPSRREVSVFREIREREAKILSEFFERTIHVPPVPEYITKEQYDRWMECGFEIHYFPSENMGTKQNQALKQWEEKPILSADRMPNGALRVQGGWFLIDTRQKPDWDAQEAVYIDKNNPTANDPIAELLPNKKRFGIHPNKFKNQSFWKPIANYLGVDVEKIDLPPLIIWNLIANIYHKEWGDTRSYDWLKEYDKKFSAHRLVSGRSVNGGVSCVSSYSDASASVGFRPLVRLL